MKIERVLAGGQTGADLAFLLAAEKLDIPTGGEAPLGYRTEAGSQPILGTRFNLTESKSKSYVPRTETNVRSSDATIILSNNPKSSGTKLTIDFCVKHNKPYFLANPFSDDHQYAVKFLEKNKPLIINGAGNRESVAKGITVAARDYMIEVLKNFI